jgi:predicted ribosomally synthesized peptide with SipW-like signal peptide
MKKKVILSLVTVAMVAALAVAGTMAWFTGSANVTNVFKAGSVAVEIYENNEGPSSGNMDFDSDFVPGDNERKVVTFKSTGNSDSYLRAKVTPSWTAADGTTVLSADNVGIDFNIGDTGDWVKGIVNDEFDGYYYYNGILKTDGFTSALFSNVTFTSGDNDNDYQGATLNILIEVEAIQAENGAVSAWEGFPFTEDEEV